MPELVTLGETMVQMNPTQTGPLRHVHAFHRCMGGAESNVAIGLVRLGHTAGWISRLGQDELGLYVLSTIRGEGVDVSHVRLDPAAPTGVFFKERPVVGNPSVYYYRRGAAVSRLQPADLPAEYIRGARILHVTGITPALSHSARDTVLAAMEIARAAGVLVSFDPNMRRKLWSEEEARPVFLEMARRSDILLPGRDEGELMVGAKEPEEMARRLLELGPAKVAVKLGPEGALGATAREVCRAQIPPLRPVDTVGAGDAFVAAFLAAELERLGLEAQLRRSCAAGALVTQVAGDWEALPSCDQLEDFLKGSAVIDR